MESNQQKNLQTDKQKDESYIPLSINAWGIMRIMWPKYRINPIEYWSGLAVYKWEALDSKEKHISHCTNAAKLQWLEHLWNHKIMFETGVVQAKECQSKRQVRRHNRDIFIVFFKVCGVFSLE